MKTKLTRFIIYGLAGWCVEIFWTGLGSLLSGDMTMPGFTYIWMFPIYGAAVFLEPIHNRIRKWPVLLRGGIYAVLILAAEYFSGSLLRAVIGRCPWNYSSGYAINGLMRLDYAPFWAVAGLLFERLHDLLARLTALKRTNKTEPELVTDSTETILPELRYKT